MSTVMERVPSTLTFGDEVMVATEELRLSFAVDREQTFDSDHGALTGRLHVGVAARWRDGSDLANYTPTYESNGSDFLLSEVRVDDAGLFTALRRQESATAIAIHHGFTVQLPPEFVGPVRAALQSVAQTLLGAFPEMEAATTSVGAVRPRDSVHVSTRKLPGQRRFFPLAWQSTRDDADMWNAMDAEDNPGAEYRVIEIRRGVIVVDLSGAEA